YPIIPPNAQEKRLERLHDLFKMIFTNHEIDDDVRLLIERYAIGLGYTSAVAQKVIRRSVQIFSGGLNFEDYKYLLKK
ncbi:MAG: TerB family tellurite resistance protein, partial [Flavobacteriaceae bacterium]|nr:TerB family tellurite resistance protein [Flavobacteriaceae bacterium]